MPPEKANAERQTRRAQNDDQQRDDSVVNAIDQARRETLNFFKWKRHGAWLLNEFWRSGDVRALDVFVVQLIAWRKRLINDERRAR
jgi:hypothetical protein